MADDVVVAGAGPAVEDGQSSTSQQSTDARRAHRKRPLDVDVRTNQSNFTGAPDCKLMLTVFCSL